MDTTFAGSPFTPEGSFVITNAVPVISPIADQHTGPGIPISVAFTVNDEESPATDLSLSATSSNPSVLPESSLEFGGAGANRTLRLLPSAGLTGYSVVTITVTDPDGRTISRRLRLFVERFSEIDLGLDAFATSVSHASLVDVDEDGDLDMFLTGDFTRDNTARRVLIGRNNGAASFTWEYPEGVTNHIYAADWSDFDRDGRLDLMTVEERGVYLYRQQAGVFAELRRITPVQLFANASAADYDRDGDIDITVVEQSSVTIHQQQPDGSYLRLQDPFPRGFNYNGWIDFNHDGLLDLLAGARIYQQSIYGLFTPVAPDLTNIFSFIVPDLDSDGDQDVLGGLGNDLVAALNDGTGNFTSRVAGQTPLAGMVWGDFDHDGDTDIFVSRAEGGFGQEPANARLHLNDGIANFSTAAATLSDRVSGGLLSGDLDGDGDLDLLAPGSFQRTEPRLVLNQLAVSNAPPAAPANVSAEPQKDDRVTLSWEPRSDDHTPASALTYEVRIGTSPGAVNIVVPASDPLTGCRRAVRPGSAGALTDFNLHHLAPGQYFWSVQAVDGAFVGSAWAPEQSFVIAKPVISPIADLATQPAVPSRPIPFAVTSHSTPPGLIVVSARSSGTNLVANEAMTISGTDSNRTLVLTPANQTGWTMIRLVATDAQGFSDMVDFRVTVGAFTEEPTATPFTGDWGYNGASVWADIDTDGDLDLATFGIDASRQAYTQLFRNPGDGRFQPVTNTAVGLLWDTLLAGDFNHDNVPDILFSGFAQGQNAWPAPSLRFGLVAPGRSDFALQPAETGLTRWWGPQTGGGAFWLDVNHDGSADAVLWGNPSTNELLQQTLAFPLVPGTGFMAPFTVIDSNPGWMAWADFDRDGDLDVAASGASLYLNDGTGQYTRQEAGLPALRGHISTADYDQDGWPDLLLLDSHPFEARPPRLFRNLGNATFTEVTSNLPLLSAGSALWGDFDNDGRTDVLLYSWGGLVAFRNEGGGQFSELPTDFPPFSSLTPSLGDADGDGDLDLLIGGEDHFFGVQYLCRNNAVRSNTAPAAPSGLRITHGTNGVMLRWDPATDAETPSPNLSYNLRIGATPGGSGIVSPLADLATGRRRVTGPGNAGQAPLWWIAGLANGTYYWSVQAIDPTESGGVFAAEQSFKISRPRIEGLTNLVVAPNVSAGPFAFTVSDAETSASALTITVSSLNPEIIPEISILILGNAATRELRLTPAPHRSGRAVLRFTVVDGDGEVQTADITVTVGEEFAFVETGFTPMIRGAAAWGDADQDGDLDLLLGGFAGLPFAEGSGRCELWRNASGMLTTNGLASLGDAGAGAVAFVDADNDGDLDAHLSGGPSATRFFWQTAPGDFSEATPSPFASATRSAVAWGDYDGDGDADAVVSGALTLDGISRARTWLYTNQKPFGFSNSTLLFDGLRDGSAEWVDVDNDGDHDLFLTGSTEWHSGAARTLLFRNDGGSLTGVNTGLPNVSFSAASFADFDLDGDPDLALAGLYFTNNSPRPLTRLYRNDGTGRFAEVSSELPGYAHGALVWGDYDGDGDPDLLISGIGPQDYRTELWFNDGGVLRPSDNHFSGGSGRGLAWGDYDRDGDLDVVIAGSPDDGWSPPRIPYFTGLFRNDLNHGGATPPSPIDLTAESAGNDMILSWSMPAGAPRGLSFNLRVGTSPGSSDVMSAHADSTSGVRLVAANGNAGWSGSWRLRNLPVRTYYWSVQAIDPAYRNSRFANETSFVVGNERPAISDIPDQFTTMNQLSSPIPFTVSDADSDPATLVVSVRSSNTNLVSDANISITGNGAERVMTVTPSLNRSGLATITVTVRDGGGANATDTFRFIVNPLLLSSTQFPNVLAHVLAPADYDGDGSLDLFLGGREPTGPGSSRGYAAVLRGDGQGGFVQAATLPPTLSEVFGAWGDFDRDGDLDLLHTGAVYRNDGGTFTEVWNELREIAEGAAAWGDFDNDSDLDFAICGRPIITRIYRNDGNGQFTDIQAPLMGVWIGALAWCDSDSDGDLDLLVSGAAAELVPASPFAQLYRNEGGVFVADREFFGVVNGRIAWGEVNHDGRPDLAYAGTHGSETIARLYVNLGTNQFVEAPLPSGGSIFPGLTFVDWDNDGDLDFARHTSSTFGIHSNDGLGAFSASSAASSNTRATILSAGDFDNDGDPDVIVAGTTTAGAPSIRVYQNPRISPPLPAPAGLTATVEGDSVLLSWPEATNPGGHPLSYNLRVGSRPGAADVLSPMADTLTGVPLLPQAGNAGAVNFHRLRGLRPGTYYWSVQTLDAAWNGFPFASETNFVITTPPLPPRFTGVSVLGGSQLRVTISARPGSTVLIERSEDLVSWSSIGTYQIDAFGALTWTGTRSGTTAFFRFREAP